MATQKILSILRHGKAETGVANQDDHDRSLNKRGLEASRSMGVYMVQKGLTPDLVLCSTAERARQTWAQAQKAFKKNLPVEYSGKLYLASASETLNLLSLVDDEVKSLLIVGHNPGFHQLCIKLAKEGDEKLLETMYLKFPTGALATLTFTGPWHNIANARAKLIDFATPKGSA